MKILLAFDNSTFSQEAMRTLARQFRTKGTRVRVLHVVEPISGYISADMIPHFVPYVAKVEKDRRKEAGEIVERAAGQLRKAGFQASGVVEQGDPQVRIIEHADVWHADLIVLGSHGLKGWTRLLMGSVSDAVTRHAGCSVEVVRSRNAAKRTKQRKSRT